PIIAFTIWQWAGWTLFGFGLINVLLYHFPEKLQPHKNFLRIGVTVLAVTFLLATQWMPLGSSNSLFVNFIFIALILALTLGAFSLFLHVYPKILMWCLEHKKIFLAIPVFV